MEGIRRITLEEFVLPAKLPDDVEEAAAALERRHFVAANGWGDVKKVVTDSDISPFEAALRAKAGYSRDNIPAGNVETPIEIDGKIAAIVTTKRQPDQTPYTAVLDQFKAHLAALETQRERHKVTGVVTINDELYIRATDAKSLLEKFLEEAREDGDGIQQSIKLETFPEPPVQVEVPVGQDFGNLTLGNLERYVRAKAFVKEGEKRYEAIKDALKHRSLTLLGVTNPEELEQTVKVEHTEDELICTHLLWARDRTEYSKVVEAFLKVPSDVAKLQARWGIGDFIVAESMQKHEEKLRETGKLDAKFTTAYKPQPYEGTAAIRLAGIGERLAYHTRNNTKSELQTSVKIGHSTDAW